MIISAVETKAVGTSASEEGRSTFVLPRDTSIIAGVCVAESARKTTRPSAAATLPMGHQPVAHSSVMPLSMRTVPMCHTWSSAHEHTR